MRLLICTQAVDEDDPVLGFFCAWITRLAARAEAVHVICLKQGRHSLPKNVFVHSLGKEDGRSVLKYISRFYRYAWGLRHEYDAAFVHMNQEYVLLGGVLWRLFNKRIVLWRNHKMGTFLTSLACRISTRVCYTSGAAYVASFSNAMRMPIGIDTEVFSPGTRPEPGTILFLGRLDAVKRPGLFLEAMRELAKTHPKAHADIYGDPTPGREGFARELKEHFSSQTNIVFHGSVSNDKTPALYRSHAIYVNMTPAGSFDKTIGEAMASGAVVVAANSAVSSVLGEFFTDTEDPKRLANIIARAIDMSDEKRAVFGASERAYIEKEHSLSHLVDLLVGVLNPRARIRYVVNARMPSGKAYGIQIAKMCEAFIESGADLTLVIPTTEPGSMRDYYGLRVDVPTVRLWTPDLYAWGRLPYALASVFFMLSSSVYLLVKRLRGSHDFVYTIDMDTFSFIPYPLLGSVVAEMHETKQPTLGKNFFFRRVRRVVATNAVIRDSLRSAFSLGDANIAIEPNGVDLAHYGEMPKEEARAKLHLPQTKRIALYVGRFYSWKGLSVIAEAAHLASDTSWYLVGGDSDDFKKASGLEALPGNLHFGGVRPFKEIPAWLAAADVLVVAGTKKNERSYRYTSPMKLYEYMAAERPIVASKTPALMSIAPHEAVEWYEPDSAADLVRAVNGVHARSEKMIERARTEAHEHSWKRRAERILSSVL